MDLIAIRRAAALIYFPLERLNPLHKAVDLDVTKILIDRYGFLKFPTTYAEYNDVESGGIFFGMGKWGALAIDELRFFANGVLVATGESTQRAEEFFADAMTVWAQVGLSFSPEWIWQRAYISQVAVRSDVDLVNVNAAVSKLIEKFFQSPAGVASLSFFTNGNIDAPPPVRIERLIGLPINAGQFWSQAPISTDMHLAFLEEYEKLLA